MENYKIKVNSIPESPGRIVQTTGYVGGGQDLSWYGMSDVCQGLFVTTVYISLMMQSFIVALLLKRARISGHLHFHIEHVSVQY